RVRPRGRAAGGARGGGGLAGRRARHRARAPLPGRRRGDRRRLGGPIRAGGRGRRSGSGLECDDPEATVGDPGLDARRASCLRLLVHDLNNPLTAIRILAEMLGEEAEGEARRDLQDVLEAADLATALVDGLSAVTHLEDGAGDEDLTWTHLDLASIVRQVVD